MCSAHGGQAAQIGSAGVRKVEDIIVSKLKDAARIGNFVFLGGYMVRSRDGGHSWQGPIIPPPTPGETAFGLSGQPMPAYNRGAMCQGKDGRLY